MSLYILLQIINKVLIKIALMSIYQGKIFLNIKSSISALSQTGASQLCHLSNTREKLLSGTDVAGALR